MRAGTGTVTGTLTRIGASENNSVISERCRKRRQSSSDLFAREARLDKIRSHMLAFARRKDRPRCVVCKKKFPINCASCYVFMCVKKRQGYAVSHQMSAEMLEAMRAKPSTASNNGCSSTSSTSGCKQQALEH